MADCVSVMAFTLVGDEKRRLGERRISAMGRFLLPSLEAEWNCVGGSGGYFSKSARNGAPPVVSLDVKKTNALYFAVKAAHPPQGLFDEVFGKDSTAVAAIGRPM
jgi:hypothetical protein